MFLFAPRSAMRSYGSKKGRVAVTPSEILKALSQGHKRLGDALEAASSQRSKVSSLLLEKLAQAVAEIERIEAAGFLKSSLRRFLKAPSPLFYGVFLLADWREKAAYRPFARLMRFPWVAHDNLLGEPAIEEPGYRIMASLFDGDPQFIVDIILDVGPDPSVRFWQWHALTLIGLEGNLDRTVAADFARQAFGKLSPDEEKPLIWAGWEKLISRLALTELAPLFGRFMTRICWSRAPMKSFNRTSNTPSRILTPLVAQGMNSKRWLASESWEPWVELSRPGSFVGPHGAP
jgi:Protein of unknown function (DUF1186)